MRPWPRVRWPLACVLALGLAAPGLLGPAPAQDAKKDKSDTSRRVTFRTYDGVDIQGTFFPPVGTKRDVTVLLLHNFEHKKGGNSHQDGWDEFAAELQKQGYAVLSFDFRGFGESKTVGREFWDKARAPDNQIVRGAQRMPPPDTIDHKDFPPAYYPSLVNDVAAARAYLDRKNDANEVNTSNLVLIGAGEGATIGALWLDSEFHRRKWRGSLTGIRPDLDEPEGKDVAAAVWLSISPRLAGVPMGTALHSWIVETGAQNRVPTAFLYGADDAEGQRLAKQYKAAILAAAGARNKEKMRFTGEHGVPGTKLRGNELLSDSLETRSWILDKYLKPLLDERGVKEARKKDAEKFRYFWSFPPAADTYAKMENQDLPFPVPLRLMRVPSGP
jgi:hypothetical protein